MSFWDELAKLGGAEETAPEMERAPAAPVAPVVAAPAPAPMQAVDEGYDVRSAIAPVLEARQADYVAPQVSIGVSKEDRARAAAREAEMKSSLEKLRDQYALAQDDARSRTMKQEMLAAFSDNIGNIVGGAQAMNTKASVTPIKSTPLKVGDHMGRVDKNFRSDYDNLLKQYKDLKDGELTAKDMLNAQTTNAYLKAGERRQNENIVNSNKSNLARGVTLINKAEEQDEMTTKQTDQLVGIDSTLDSLSKLDGMKDFSTGPISGRIENVKRYLGQSSGNRAAMASQLEMLTSQYGKAISGATIADAEMARIQKQLPKETDSDEMFASKLANFQDELTNSRVRVLDSIKRSGRSVKNFEKRVTVDQLKAQQAPAKNGTVKIQGPSGQTATVSAEAAEKYLAKPGYKKVN